MPSIILLTVVLLIILAIAGWSRWPSKSTGPKRNGVDQKQSDFPVTEEESDEVDTKCIVDQKGTIHVELTQHH